METRRGFIIGVGAAAAELPLLAGCLSGGKARRYSVAILGDTHFDAEPATVYHSHYDGTNKHSQTHHEEFARNGEMWRKRCPRLLAASAELARSLTALDDGSYGKIVRAKGIVSGGDGKWLHFDYVPEEHEVREGAADVTGRFCVIGGELAEDRLKELFGV